ncbi:MAG TPA: VWA domain-containing protein [Thermoanaerobaculia bacterium]|nr:VWA domain-containing protein [Thermoanaerobaculia bacterium]
MRKLLFAIVSCPFALFAQSTGPLPPLTEQVEVHVVNVDVSVTDRGGNPVAGLTKDDFEIFEDGKPEKITNFSVISATRSVAHPAAGAAAPPPENRRRILLIVDNNYLSVIDRNHALDTVQKYLDSSFSGEWAVAVIGHGVDMLQSFTGDKARIDAALVKARHTPSAENHHEIDRAQLSDLFNRRNDFSVPGDARAKFAFSSREQTFRNLLAVENTARAVVDTARAYSAEGGKKFIILLTGGMEANTTFSAYEKPNDPELREMRLQIGEITDAMVREANGANFTIHIVNARAHGMPAPQADVTNRSSGNNLTGDLLQDVANQPIDVSDVDSIPFSVAVGTGGMYLPSSDLHDSLQRIDTVTSSFYSLGYSPSHNGDRQYHTIKVRVKRRGVTVANRVGYFDQTPEDRLEQMLRARIHFDDGFGSIPVQVQIGEASPAEHDLIVPVTAEMPLARITVVPQDQNYVGRVHVYCSVFDADGRNIGFSHKEQQVTLAPAQLSSRGDFRYTMKVHLKKGEAFTIVITLRDELSNEIGSASEAVRL